MHVHRFRISVAVGDYIAGPSHVLPTGGSARFASPLGIEDFMKVISVVAFDEHRLRYFGDAVIGLAEAEGLTAHAQTIKLRLKNHKKK
jgi:histidinol dehydrogenase